jgi:hypothetical protein
VGKFDTSVDEFNRFAAPHIVRISIQAIAEACVSDPDQRLHDLLVDVIGECASMGAVRDPEPAHESPVYAGA